MPTYEMLWDCGYCGTRKLLGKTHRFCPGCGAPQDPSKRYFPPDDEKVAVEDHEYVGADRTCAACQSAMSAKAAHCTQCGSPMEGAGEVALVAEGAQGRLGVVAGGVALPPADTSRGKKGGKGCLFIGLAAVGLVAVGLLVALFWRQAVEARVTGHAWERAITVEKLAPRQESEWCDSMPRDAYSVTRQREVRETRQVPDGEDCRAKKVDQGDGTYREEQECTPRYRGEPVHDMRCRYTVDRWQAERTARAEGQALSPVPSWPSLALRAGSCRGCEREGPRQARYVVRLMASKGKTFECEFDEEKWRTFAVDSRWTVKVGVLTGGAACSSLRAR